MKFIIIITIFFFLLVPVLLRDYSLDYVLVIGVILMILVNRLFRLELGISRYDSGWVIPFGFSFVYAMFAILNGNSLEIIALQSLVFFMPIYSLITRSPDFYLSLDKLSNIVLFVAVIKIISYIPYYDDFLLALTSAFDRERFHDYSSIIAVFFLFSALLNNCIQGTKKTIFVGAAAFFLAAGVAHRSLYVAIAAQVLYTGLTGSKKTFYRSMIFVAVLIFLVLVTPVGDVMIALFKDSISGSDPNTSARLNLSEAVFFASFDNPFGNGFGDVFQFGLDNKNEIVRYALQHNSLLTYLYYLGWISFIALLSWLALIFFYMKAISLQAKVYKSTIIGMVVFSYFNMFLEHPIFGFFFWIIIGMFMGQYSLDKLREKSQKIYI